MENNMLLLYIGGRGGIKIQINSLHVLTLFFGHYTQETQRMIDFKYFYHFKTNVVKAFLKKQNQKTTHQYLLKYVKFFMKFFSTYKQS